MGIHERIHEPDRSGLILRDNAARQVGEVLQSMPNNNAVATKGDGSKRVNKLVHEKRGDEKRGEGRRREETKLLHPRLLHLHGKGLGVSSDLIIRNWPAKRPEFNYANVVECDR